MYCFVCICFYTKQNKTKEKENSNHKNVRGKVSFENETDFPITYERGVTINEYQTRVIKQYYHSQKLANKNAKINNLLPPMQQIQSTSIDANMAECDNTEFNETHNLLTIHSNDNSDTNVKQQQALTWKQKYIPNLNVWEFIDLMIICLTCFFVTGAVFCVISWFTVYMHQKFNSTVIFSTGLCCI